MRRRRRSGEEIPPGAAFQGLLDKICKMIRCRSLSTIWIYKHAGKSMANSRSKKNMNRNILLLSTFQRHVCICSTELRIVDCLLPFFREIKVSLNQLSKP